MRDLDFSLFSLSCMKLHCFPWTLLHTPLPQPHCSRRISNNRTPLCLLPCSHVHSQRDIRDSGNKKQWSRSSNPALNYWELSLVHKLQVHLNSLMRNWGGGLYYCSYFWSNANCTDIFASTCNFVFLNSMLGQENISISLQ